MQTGLNGADHLALTNVDGLDGIDTIKICTSYELKGETIHTPPANSEDWDLCTPIYEEMPGWVDQITAVSVGRIHSIRRY